MILEHFSLSEVAPRDRLEHWGEFIWRHIGKLRTDTYGDPHFAGEAFFGAVGSLQLCRLIASRHRVVRTADLVRRDDHGCFKFVIQRRGAADFRQSGRHVTLEPGDWSLYDTSVPYSVTNKTEVEQIIAVVPRRVLAMPGVDLDRLTVQRFGRSGGIARIASAQLTAVVGEYAKLTERTGLEVADNLVNLLRLSLYEFADHAPGIDREILLMRIKDYIERHLREPDLSIDKIAAALKCTKRNLHETFRQESMSLSEHIWTQRLDASRRDLETSDGATCSLTEIAFRWGFSNYAHFSRVFKRRFGCSPRDFRAQRS